MLCLAAMVLVVMMVGSAHGPEYTFSLGFLLRALVGVCVVAILNQFRATKKLKAWILPCLMLLLDSCSAGIL